MRPVSATVSVSAPGSLMLFGEHAVLHGRRALACAVNRRLRVRARARPEGRVSVASSLGRAEASLERPELPHAFRFVAAVLRHVRADMPHGADIEIESEFPPTVGFGSSAAVTVCALAALRALIGARPEPLRIFLDAREVIREVQGVGSGADAAASVFGGVAAYRADPLRVERLPGTHPLTVVYSGTKTPTPEVIRIVEERRARHPEVFEALYDAIDRVSGSAETSWRAGDFARVGELMNVGQGLMESLGVCNRPLGLIVRALQGRPGILGAKISGSGLGDCALGLGRTDWQEPAYEAWQVGMSEEGLRFEQA